MRLFIWIISFIALGFALAILSAGPGTRFGLWEYGTGLTIISKMAKPTIESIALSGPIFIAAAFSLVSTILAVIGARGLLPLSLIATLGVGAAAVVPIKMHQAVQANPFIHDITTDFEAPPQILEAADLPRKNPAAYMGDAIVPGSEDGLTVAAAQQEAFPDLAPLILTLEMDEAAEAVRTAIAAMKMKVLAEGPVSKESGSGWRIEAVYTSTWFAFKDDFVVRLSSEGDDAVRIDVRSKSRVGGSDLGANAARVREFLGKMNG